MLIIRSLAEALCKATPDKIEAIVKAHDFKLIERPPEHKDIVFSYKDINYVAVYRREEDDIIVQGIYTDADVSDLVSNYRQLERTLVQVILEEEHDKVSEDF
jgi:hypothetical protein